MIASKELWDKSDDTKSSHNSAVIQGCNVQTTIEKEDFVA